MRNSQKIDKQRFLRWNSFYGVFVSILADDNLIIVYINGNHMKKENMKTNFICKLNIFLYKKNYNPIF